MHRMVQLADSTAGLEKAQFLGRHGEFDVAAEPFVFVDDEGDDDGDAGVADSAGL